MTQAKDRPGRSPGVWKGRQVQYRKDRLVVAVDRGALIEGETLAQRLKTILRETPGSAPLRGPGRTGRALVSVPESEDVLEMASRLDRRADVRFAEPDFVDHAAPENGADTDSADRPTDDRG